MRMSISGEDLIGQWRLSFADIDFVKNAKPVLSRLALAVQLKFFGCRFLRDRSYFDPGRWRFLSGRTAWCRSWRGNRL
jgi:hypothetical protein